MLEELRRAAEVKRAARHRLADATAEHGARSVELDPHRRAHEVATAYWVELLRSAVAVGVPIADVARAAGVAPSSVHYRLSSSTVSTAADQVNQDRP